MDALVIDGKSYKVPILTYRIEPQILDGEGTGRSASIGWTMVRDPNGTLINLTVKVGILTSSDPEFTALWDKIMSLGVTDFANVQIILPNGVNFTQQMYVNPKNIEMRRIRRDGVSFWGQWEIFWGAKEAYLTP